MNKKTMNKMGRKKSKYYSRIGLVLLVVSLVAFPVPAFISFLLVKGGEYYTAVFIFMIFFILPLLIMLKDRNVIYLEEKYFCYWSFFEGKCKIEYKFIYSIKYQLVQFKDIPVDRGSTFTICFYSRKGNKKYAKFTAFTPSYIPHLLNFLQDKVEENIIDNISFEQGGLRIRKIDGQYTYYYKKKKDI